MSTKRLLVLLAVAVACASGTASGTAAGSTADSPALRGARFIVARQQPDGGFFTAAAAADQVGEALASVASVAGSGGEPVARALSYIAAHGPARAGERAAYAGRIVMGLVAAGQNPRAFHGTNYTAVLNGFYNPVTGAYDTGIYADALALLGVAAAGEAIPDGAFTYVRANQCGDGGFSHEAGCVQTPDVDTTAAVVCAFAQATDQATRDARTRARAFLARARNPDGGFGLEAGKTTNANSTGLALAAIASLGERPVAKPWRDAHGDPLAALGALQTAGGGFRYQATDDAPNDYATVQALVGLAGTGLPLHAASSYSRGASRVPAHVPHASNSSPLDGAPVRSSRDTAERDSRARPQSTPGHVARAAAAGSDRGAARAGGNARSGYAMAGVGVALAALILRASLKRSRRLRRAAE